MSQISPALVYVHGIAKHTPGYSDEWFAALQPHLTVNVERFEVLWSDIVNAKAMAAGEDSGTFAANVAAEETLRSEVEEELRHGNSTTAKPNMMTFPKGLKEFSAAPDLLWTISFVTWRGRVHAKAFCRDSPT